LLLPAGPVIQTSTLSGSKVPEAEVRLQC